MHAIPALALGTLRFGSRRDQPDPIAAVRLALYRWRVHARIGAITAALSDLNFNPFLFQIE